MQKYAMPLDKATYIRLGLVKVVQTKIVAHTLGAKPEGELPHSSVRLSAKPCVCCARPAVMKSHDIWGSDIISQSILRSTPTESDQ